MADRRALVITSPGVMSLQDAAELVPGPGEVVARPVLRESSGPRGKVILDVSAP